MTYSGGTPSRERPDFFGGDIPWVKSGEVVGVVTKTTESLTEAGLRNSSAKWVEPGALLIAMYGAGLTAGQVARLAIRATTNQAVLAVVPNRPEESEFIGLALSAVVPRLLRRKQGSGQPNLNAKIIRRASIPWPDEPVRRGVERVVRALDSMAAGVDDLGVATRTFKRGLMQQLLTGKTRFPQFRCRPWHFSRLADHVVRVTRRNASGLQLVLTASGEHGLVDQRTYFNRTVAGADLTNYYLLRRGEFAYNRSAMSGYPFGATKRLDEYDEGVLSTLYLCFGISDPELDSDYLKHVFESGVLNRQLRPIVRVGARAHGLLNVSDDDYLSISIPFPKKDEQRRIADALNSVDQELGLIGQFRENIELQRRGLLAKLLAGDIQIRS